MNLAVLKTFAFWMTALPTILALLITSHVVLSGSTVDIVVGWVVAVLGMISGHTVQLNTPAPATATLAA